MTVCATDPSLSDSSRRGYRELSSPYLVYSHGLLSEPMFDMFS